MIVLNPADRNLLMRVLETEPDLSRKGNPRLRPLSLYSTELKNLKQVAAAVERASNGQALHATGTTAKRYGNTLSNLGIWSGGDRSTNVGAAGEKLLQLAQTNNGDATVFWNQNTRAGDRIFFEHQLNRFLTGQEKLVNTLWRETFFNVQDVLDHLSEDYLRTLLADAELRGIEALQYMDSVGTEPWRFTRLNDDEKAAALVLIVRLYTSYQANQATQGDSELTTAKQYAQAMNAYQRDVRFRVAGFLEAFLDMRASLGSDFPRLTPSLEVKLRSRTTAQNPAGAGAAGAQAGPKVPRPKLPLPLQVIISGCPGSGKSNLADRSAISAQVIRTQFHSETTTASFVGGYRPVPVYEAAADITEVTGAPFQPGRPMIDYRFVPGPALDAIAAAKCNPNENVVLLIEELNRGNAAAIFGELFQLLDRADDGGSRYGVTLGAEAMVWLRTQNALDADGNARFPANLHIWATMNSGDQGVYPIDTAFRRRWAYRYLGYAQPCLYPAEDRVVRFGGRDLDWDRLRAALNRILKKLPVQEDRLIGPYFLTPAQLQDPDDVLTKLLLYLWDDVLRFRQQEVFNADSFAQVGIIWRNGEGNPLIEGIINLDDAEVAPEVDPADAELGGGQAQEDDNAPEPNAGGGEAIGVAEPQAEGGGAVAGQGA